MNRTEFSFGEWKLDCSKFFSASRTPPIFHRMGMKFSWATHVGVFKLLWFATQTCPVLDESSGNSETIILLSFKKKFDNCFNPFISFTETKKFTVELQFDRSLKSDLSLTWKNFRLISFFNFVYCETLLKIQLKIIRHFKMKAGLLKCVEQEWKEI